jgi:hypothetical protein
VKHRYIWLAALAIVFSVVSVVTIGWVSGFSSNLGAGFVGSLLTVFLIDRALEASRQRQADRVKRVAFDRLRTTLIRHLTFLFNLHKAAATSAPTHAPACIADLFKDEYFEAVRWLDFSQPGPETPPRTWFLLAAQEAQDLRRALERMVDTYLAFLDPEHIENMESLEHSSLIVLLLQSSVIPEIDRREGFRRQYNLLYDRSMIEELRKHVTFFQALITQFNSCATRVISLSDLSLWRRDVAPDIGSARLRSK